MNLRKKLHQGEIDVEFNALNHQPENNDHIVNYILANNGHLPPQPLFEKHPYLDDFELQYFDKYIIGTFPPISYLYFTHNLNILRQPNGTRIKKPGFSFFHGNKGLLWDYFLNIEELNNLPIDKELKPNYLKNILISTKINYCDIVSNVRRKLEQNKYKGSDILLYNIVPNSSLVNQILNNPKAKYLMFNTASIYGMSGIEIDGNGMVSLDKDSKSFDLFLRTLQELDFKISLSFDNGVNWIYFENLNIGQRKTKFMFKLKISKSNFGEKEFVVITPFSPAVAQRVNILAGNPIVCNWRVNNNFQNTKDMLSQIMLHFRNNNWGALQAMNVNL